MKPRFTILLCIILSALFAAFVAPRAFAKFARTWEPVPIERLLANVGQYVKEHPNDAQGIYTLGRLHSLAFAQKADQKTADMVIKDWKTGKPLSLPAFAPFDTVQVMNFLTDTKLSREQKTHLLESLRFYRRATELDPQKALYFLGYGWMLEQGMTYLGKVSLPPGTPNGKPSPDLWRAQAIIAYRKAYELAIPDELKPERRNYSLPENKVGVEAGKDLVRLLKTRPRSKEEEAEIGRVNADIAKAEANPGWITPLILSLRPSATVSDLLAANKHVTFDLAGYGEKQRWPWLRPDTGLLVWDPNRTGRITSGSQLFGSRTWQMFWKDGYEPLAALDEDRDGWLTGKELDGLAVWFDRNGNGVSEKGEVMPVGTLGIVRIAVRSNQTSEGVPANLDGVELRDGTRLPTYDWTPRVLPELRPARIDDRFAAAWE